MAVKILIKRKFKDGDMQTASKFLIANRNLAMQQSGYISSETLRNLDDQNQVVVVSMWQNLAAWNAWKNSEARMANETEFKDYLIGETVYENYSLGLSME